MRARLLLLPAIAAIATVAPPAPASPGPMDELARVFTRGRAINVQLAFDSDHADHDWCMNTTVAEVTDERDERGERTLTITTAPWSVNGTRHVFRATVREGKLERFELRHEVEGAWAPAPAAAFRFDVEERVAATQDEQGEVVLSVWGLCNEGRGSAHRTRATVVLRSFSVPDAADLSY